MKRREFELRVDNSVQCVQISGWFCTICLDMWAPVTKMMGTLCGAKVEQMSLEASSCDGAFGEPGLHRGRTSGMLREYQVCRPGVMLRHFDCTIYRFPWAPEFRTEGIC